MDHMTFMTIFSLLATVGMVLVITWGMGTVDPQGQGCFQSSASGRFGERPCVSHPPYELRTDMMQGFVPWDLTRDVSQAYPFQPPLDEMAYRTALKELLAEQARQTPQEREAAQQQLNQLV